MPVELRACHGIEDFRACVALQKEVWNFTDAELVPLRMFVVADKVGGQVMGAFDGNTLVGFALSVPGTRSGHIYLHSHMLAVRKDHRNSGLGRRLKMMQREEALARGIELIEWTFDPLEIKNAYLNIEKLGAIARRVLEKKGPALLFENIAGYETGRCTRLLTGALGDRRRLALALGVARVSRIRAKCWSRRGARPLSLMPARPESSWPKAKKATVSAFGMP
jgi:GNAT superfamily N-acetyltransferase